MNSKSFRLTRTQKLAAIIFTLLIGIIFLAWWQFNPIAAEIPALDDQVLKQKGLTLAHNLGLKGDPISEKIERMTLAEAGKLVDAELGTGAAEFGLKPQMPVFVYALRGEITPTGPGEINPNNPKPKYDRMLIILNAETGDMIIQADYYVGAPMPIALP